MTECDCGVRSSMVRVFTCPVCSGKAYRALVWLDADMASQMDLFEVGGGVSVSALDELSCFEAEQRRFAAIEDGLPF